MVYKSLLIHIRFQTSFENDVAIMVSLWVIVKAYVFVSLTTICIKYQTSFGKPCPVLPFPELNSRRTNFFVV